MIKTTVYLDAELKAALTALARQRQVSEATIIRDAVHVAVSAGRPRPAGALFETAPIAERAEELLAGFGER